MRKTEIKRLLQPACRVGETVVDRRTGRRYQVMGFTDRGSVVVETKTLSGAMFRVTTARRWLAPVVQIGSEQEWHTPLMLDDTPKPTIH